MWFNKFKFSKKKFQKSFWTNMNNNNTRSAVDDDSLVNDYLMFRDSQPTHHQENYMAEVNA